MILEPVLILFVVSGLLFKMYWINHYYTCLLKEYLEKSEEHLNLVEYLVENDKNFPKLFEVKVSMGYVNTTEGMKEKYIPELERKIEYLTKELFARSNYPYFLKNLDATLKK